MNDPDFPSCKFYCCSLLAVLYKKASHYVRYSLKSILIFRTCIAVKVTINNKIFPPLIAKNYIVWIKLVFMVIF